jgi:dTDP-4-amino-4,6-dideoxygalactose transaminase
VIPFLDIQAQYRALAPEIEHAVLAVLRSGEYVLGSRVASFERNFAAFCGTQYAIGVNSGTSALHLALLAAGVGPGDEVVTVSATFVATTAAILYAGARPVFVDIDPRTWTMDPGQIESVLTPWTKAILPVHFHGRLADMDAIMKVARKHDLVVIEDAAQAHGAERDGKKAGTFGDIGCFSFYPGKNLGACGEGGGVVTNRADFDAAIRRLRDWGQAARYEHVVHGYNYRMDGIQGAVLDVKLKHLASWIEGRRRAAGRYRYLLAGSGIGLPAPAGLDHVWHVFAVRIASGRGKVREELNRSGIATGFHYPCPVHLQPAYAELGYRRGDLPVTGKLAGETLSLPIYPEMTASQVEEVADAVARSCAVLDAEVA